MRLWIISTLVCLGTTSVYVWQYERVTYQIIWHDFFYAQEEFSRSPQYNAGVDKSGSATLAQDEQEDIYRAWYEKGKTAEKLGNVGEALRCYTWAFSYRPNTEIEKLITELQTRLRREQEQANTQENFLERAFEYERAGAYDKALSLYQKLPEQREDAIQTRIQTCRKILEIEQIQQEMLHNAEQNTEKGEWARAVESYREIERLYQQWPKFKEQSRKIITRLSLAQTRYRLLQHAWTEIEKYLKVGRTAMALRYVKALPTQLPQEGIWNKLITLLHKEMVLIPAGVFTMGSTEHPDEMPPHLITLPEYCIDRYEVTNRQYEVFVASTGAPIPTTWSSDSVPQELKAYPVSSISWEEATQYALWAGKRLPTEAEWERAARGDDGRIYPWGNNFSADHCNCLEVGRKGAAAVGSFPQGVSPFGCFDMLGNVLEWTADEYGPYPGGEEPGGRQSGYRVTRGGAWYYPGKNFRCTTRYPHLQTVRLVSVGFRCAWSSSAAGKEQK